MEATAPESGFSLAIILIYWNDAVALESMLDILSHSAPQKSEVWVVDNASLQSFTSSKQYPFPLHYLRSRDNLGYAGGVNLALTSIHKRFFKYVLLLNTDVRFIEGGLTSFCEEAHATPEVDFFGPVIIEGKKRYYGGRDPGRYLNTRLEAPDKPDYLPGTMLLGKSTVWREVGMLDERFFFSGEIADFCYRARKSGYKLKVISETEIRHQVESKPSLRESLYFYYNLRNRFLYVRKHFKAKKLIFSGLWTVRGIRILLGAIFTGKWSRARCVAWSLFDGLIGNFGNRNDRFL